MNAFEEMEDEDRCADPSLTEITPLAKSKLRRLFSTVNREKYDVEKGDVPHEPGIVEGHPQYPHLDRLEFVHMGGRNGCPYGRFVHYDSSALHHTLNNLKLGYRKQLASIRDSRHNSVARSHTKLPRTNSNFILRHYAWGLKQESLREIVARPLRPSGSVNRPDLFAIFAATNNRRSKSEADARRWRISHRIQPISIEIARVGSKLYIPSARHMFISTTKAETQQPTST
ncbi:hypothetical protein Trydic_g2543 [Trypoxylus dichotomus]